MIFLTPLKHYPIKKKKKKFVLSKNISNTQIYYPNNISITICQTITSTIVKRRACHIYYVFRFIVSHCIWVQRKENGDKMVPKTDSVANTDSIIYVDYGACRIQWLNRMY